MLQWLPTGTILRSYLGTTCTCSVPSCSHQRPEQPHARVRLTLLFDFLKRRIDVSGEWLGDCVDGTSRDGIGTVVSVAAW